MSLINKMLQDLDRRNAGQASATAGALGSQAQPIPGVHIGSDWFWRALAALMFVAVVWVVWLMWELRPRAVVTELVLKAPRPAAAASSSTTPDAVPPPSLISGTGPSVRTEAVAPSEVPAIDTALLYRPQIGGLRLSTELTLRSVPSSREHASPDQRLVAAVRKPQAESPVAKAQIAKHRVSNPELSRNTATTAPARAPDPPVAQPRASASPSIDKRDTSAAGDRVNAESRRALALVSQGKIAEALEAFRTVLAIDPGRETNRQTMIALLLESRRYEEAMQVLNEGIAINPKNTGFAMSLARVMVERGNVAEALPVMDRHAALATGNPDFRAFRAALLQRVSRHTEAAEEYRAALRLSPEAGQWWLGLGISLQALSQSAAALEAFRRAKDSDLSPELLAFADRQIRQLH